MNPRTAAAVLAVFGLLVSPAVAKEKNPCRWNAAGKYVCYDAPRTASAARPAAQRHPPAQRRPSAESAWVPGSGFPVVREAKKYIGQDARQVGLHRRTLWCAAFLNAVLKRAGYRGSGSDQAKSFGNYAPRIRGPRVGAIVWLSGRGPTGHVGVISEILPSGDLKVISGNHNNRVAEAVYPRRYARAYVMPRT